MKETIMFDSNVFINDETFDKLKEKIDIIKEKYNLILTPYQIYQEIESGRLKDARTQEKIDFCKTYFKITYDINIFPFFFGMKFCTEDQLKVYDQLLYRILSGKIETDSSVVNNYLDQYPKDKKFDKKQRDVRIGSIASFEDATVIINGDRRFQKSLQDLEIKNQKFENFIEKNSNFWRINKKS